jgi:hypothetical protein
MVTVDSTGYFRISRKASKEAGFRVGQRLAVVQDPNHRSSFNIVSSSRVSKSREALRYSVEKDGRIRVNSNRLNSLGVSRTSKNRSTSPNFKISRGCITVNI